MYLINRLPARHLHNVSHWEKLFQQRPVYSSLRVFGSACYPWLKPYNLTKLDPKTRRCVFLGYSLNQKGYKCLDMTSGRIFMSRHAAFNEDVFPFSSVGPSTPVPSSPASFTPFQWLSSVTPSSVLGPFKSPASSSIVGPAPHICPFPMTVPLPSCSTPSPTLTTTSPSTTPLVRASSQCPLHPPSPTVDLSLPISPHTTPPTSPDVLGTHPPTQSIPTPSQSSLATPQPTTNVTSSMPILWSLG